MALSEILQKLDYDTYRLITFRWEESLWFDDPVRFQAHVRDLGGDFGVCSFRSTLHDRFRRAFARPTGESFERPGQKMELGIREVAVFTDHQRSLAV